MKCEEDGKDGGDEEGERANEEWKGAEEGFRGGKGSRDAGFTIP